MSKRASSTKRKQAYQPPNLELLTPIERVDFPFGRAYAPLLSYLEESFKTQEWTKENQPMTMQWLMRIKLLEKVHRYTFV